MESIIVWLATISIILLIIFLSSKLRRSPKATPSRRIAGPSSPLPFSIPTQVAERISAAEMLSRIQVLRGKDAQWDVILSDLNPTDDPEVQRLLLEIRGPHMFSPHVGLSVIEDGCKRVLAISPKADALDALRQAIRGQEPFVQ